MTVASVNPSISEKSVSLDGFHLRYLEAGEGPAVLMLHGASLGSSADVFRRNMMPVAEAGFRALALDLPGYGGSAKPDDHSAGFRKQCILGFLDALGLKRVALVGHSQSGTPAAQMGLQAPEHFSHLVVLATGSLLPPMEVAREGLDAKAQQRLERRMATVEPSIDDTRKLLESNLYNHDLITPDELALRHSQSVGENFKAFVARSNQPETPKSGGAPLWQKLGDIKVPLLLIYGKNDRANAFERATKLKELYPQLNLHIVDKCKHLLPWDAADDLARLMMPFLKSA